MTQVEWCELRLIFPMPLSLVQPQSETVSVAVKVAVATSLFADHDETLSNPRNSLGHMRNAWRWVVAMPFV